MQQTEYAHTGFFHLVLMGLWFQFLDVIGVVSASTLSQVQNAAEHNSAFNDLVIAARCFSAMSIGAFSIAVYSGLRFLTGHRSISALMAGLFCFSPGVVEQAIRIHTELFSAMFVFTAFFLVVAAARTHGWRSLLWLALAAACSILSMYSKMQALPLLLMLPVAALAFGTRVSSSRIDPLIRMEYSTVMAVCITSMAFSVIAITMIIAKIITIDGAAVIISPQIVLPVFTAYFLLLMLLYTWIYRPHWKSFFLGVSSLGVGTSTGLYFVFVHNDPEVVTKMVNIIDHMAAFSTAREGDTLLAMMNPDSFRSLLLVTMINNYWDSLVRSFSFNVQEKNIIIGLYWVLTGGILWSLATRKWRLAFQLSIFLGTAISMEAYCRIRYFAPWYNIYVEPWVLFGCAHLFSSLISNSSSAALRTTTNIKQHFLVAGMLTAVAILPFAVSDSFTDRIYINDKSACPTITYAAPMLPKLACFERQSIKN